jgi:hypothetical protein
MTDVKQLAEKLRTLAHGLDMGFLHEDDAMAVFRAALEDSEAGAESSLRNVQRSGATHRHKKRGSEYVLIGFGLWTGINQYVEDDADLSVKEVAPGVWSICEQYERPADGEWARLQTNRHLNLADAMAIYRSVDDGSLWVRPREEFEDGRFEDLRALSTQRETAR